MAAVSENLSSTAQQLHSLILDREKESGNRGDRSILARSAVLLGKVRKMQQQTDVDSFFAHAHDVVDCRDELIAALQQSIASVSSSSAVAAAPVDHVRFQLSSLSARLGEH